MPWGKRIVLYCQRTKGHWGAHRNRENIW
jgi:hypothetical protein